MNKESAIPWQKSIFVNKTIRHKKSPPLNHPNENNLVGINVDLQTFIHHLNTVHYTSTSAHHVQLLFITTVTPSGFVTENLAVLSAQTVGAGVGAVVGTGVGTGVGAVVGTGVGTGVGAAGAGVGAGVGAIVGTGVGAVVGTGVGTGVGAVVGPGVGAVVGTGVGTGVGAVVGTGVGAIVGTGVGRGVVGATGAGVGAGVGAEVGTGVGAEVGACVIEQTLQVRGHLSFAPVQALHLSHVFFLATLHNVKWKRWWVIMNE
jgi:hypothetical protein